MTTKNQEPIERASKLELPLMHPTETWAVLRVLAIAADSDRTDPADREPVQWVAARLLKLVNDR